MNKDIIAGIVTFNPDLERLKENIDAIYSQVSSLVIVDNNSENINAIDYLQEQYTRLTIITNDENMGIAYALNQIVNYSKNLKCSWALTLDQDSVCPPYIIEEYLKYVDIDKIGAIAPRIQDTNQIYGVKNNQLNKYCYVEWCISSATLLNIDACEKINGFDDLMFIDLVDFDLCYRLRKAGYKIIKNNDVILMHQLGNLTPKKIGKRYIEVTNHNELRKYYYARNSIYLCRKYNDAKVTNERILKLVKLVIKVLTFENNKIAKLKSIFKGIQEGFYLGN